MRVVTAGAVLPPGFDFASGAGTGTGLRLVKSMLREDRASLAITSGPRRGAGGTGVAAASMAALKADIDKGAADIEAGRVEALSVDAVKQRGRETLAARKHVA